MVRPSFCLQDGLRLSTATPLQDENGTPPEAPRHPRQKECFGRLISRMSNVTHRCDSSFRIEPTGTLRLQSFFAKRLILFMFLASTFSKGVGLLMNIYERVYIFLAFHALLPLMILLFRSPIHFLLRQVSTATPQPHGTTQPEDSPAPTCQKNAFSRVRCTPAGSA